jgi:hypothetical protein
MLALADGYETTYRNLDPMKGKETLHTMKVTGQREVAVPRETSTAWKLEVASARRGAGSSTIWWTSQPQGGQDVPGAAEMNGAVLTSELAP